MFQCRETQKITSNPGNACVLPADEEKQRPPLERARAAGSRSSGNGTDEFVLRNSSRQSDRCTSSSVIYSRRALDRIAWSKCRRRNCRDRSNCHCGPTGFRFAVHGRTAPIAWKACKHGRVRPLGSRRATGVSWFQGSITTLRGTFKQAIHVTRLLHRLSNSEV